MSNGLIIKCSITSLWKTPYSHLIFRFGNFVERLSFRIVSGELRYAQNYAETVPFRKISTQGNYVKLQYFSQCMFDKLNNRFQESFNVWCFKKIKRWESLQKAEAYFETKQIPTMKLFVNGYKGLIFSQ